MRNIAYFSNQFASSSGHGIAHYAHRLFEGLQIEADLNVIPVATWSDRSAADLKQLQKDSGLQLLPWGRKLTPLAWTYLNRPSIERWLDAPIDVMHMVAPGFPVATCKKLVVTVHDMGPVTHPKYFADSKPTLFKRAIRQIVRQADAIVCVSNATADALVGYAGESVSKRIQVIHEGVDATYFSREPTALSGAFADSIPVDVPFFLAVGALSPRKNIKRVLEAFQRIQQTVPHHLVLVGGGGWDSESVFKTIASPELAQRVHHLGYATDDQLQALYKRADFYIHSSLLEGFGLTVLEAMAAGCPVITSNVTSLPEVAGDAAVLVDPCSVDAIAEAIKQFALSESMREKYKCRGLERVKLFKWSETARRMAEIYRSV